MGYVLAFLFLLLVFLYSLYFSENRERKINEVFLGREALDVKSFYEKYYRDSGIDVAVVEGVKAILETNLGADLSQISKEDDFSKNLAFFWDFDSMVDVEIIIELEKYFDIKISDEEAAQKTTVDSLIRLVHNKLTDN
jgi:acyl carrier protein